MNQCRDWFERTSIVAAASIPVTMNVVLAGNFLLAASRNAVISGVLTGLIILAILTGTVGVGTAAAVMLNRVTGRKRTAIAVIVVMVLCAVVIAFTTAEPLYVSLNGWMNRKR